MSTQIIPGVMRETNNCLLLKAEIGKPLKRGILLPPDPFTYGRNSQGKTLGASDTFNWRSNIKEMTHKEKKGARDFIALNKAATNAGLVTAQEHFQFRATHQLPPIKARRQVVHVDETVQAPREDVVYGVPTKPSTPVFDLLEFKYQERWHEEMRQYDLAKRQTRKERNPVPHKTYRETRASKLRRHSPPVEPPTLWQMPRFRKKSMPALHTFRSESARRKAFLHHSSDCTSRTGVFGHGNYQSAES